MTSHTLTMAQPELLVRDQRSSICCDLSRFTERSEALSLSPVQDYFVAQAQARLEALVLAERQVVELGLETAEGDVDGPDLLLGNRVHEQLVGEMDCDRLIHQSDSGVCQFEETLEIEFLETQFARVEDELTGEGLAISQAFDEAVETLDTSLRLGTLSSLGFGNNPFAAFLNAEAGGFATANALTAAAG